MEKHAQMYLSTEADYIAVKLSTISNLILHLPLPTVYWYLILNTDPISVNFFEK